jgi:hypothetical protein
VYDTASDQRRTTALKQRIDGLMTETKDLKDIITAICTSPNRDALIEVVQSNLLIDFTHVKEVAELCRQDTQTAAAPGPVSGRRQPGFAPIEPSFTGRSFSEQSSFASRSYPDGVSRSSAVRTGWTGGMADGTPDGIVDGTPDGDGFDDKWDHQQRQGYNPDGVDGVDGEWPEDHY